ncbi:unnamed protein product [Periconia digitata]|uniref:Rhodopsin domain-containing protein n=1 Tax=Periconia digitata TaxID=1303443 RepID=A0A9W4XND6_9PLEO|nr:unnamed protein product [Periconia digitata]
MKPLTSIIVQIALLVLALIVTLLRCWIRLWNERRALTIPDYLLWGGWICTMGWVICSAIALHIQIDNPLIGDDLLSDSIAYLKTVFISCYFFDFALYFPKASLISFYWWLIPHGFRRLRIAVYVGTAFVACAFVATILTDTLIAPDISDNWSIENQLNSTWNSWNVLIIDWVLNFSTDLLLFCLPFFIINCLKLRRRQKYGLVGVFSLGIITMAISLARFIVYAATNYYVDDASGNAWCTAELCTAVIVVSLPTLKSLILRSSDPKSSADRSTEGYLRTDGSRTAGNKIGVKSGLDKGHKLDDELELMYMAKTPSGRPSTATTKGSML